MDIQFHEVADIFPMMARDEFGALRADIAEHGQREAIWLHQDGRIIDGRNRYLACVELGIAPMFRTWDGAGSLVAFVVSLNLHRRHLTESQRAMVAAKLANMRQGERTDIEPSANLQKVRQSEAAELLQVSPRSVASARAVLEQAAPELVAEVERGAVAVSAASEVARLPVEWQRVIVDNNEVSEAARDIRQGKTPHVLHNSGNNEWYTPAEYIEAARVVLGRIDLDPASSAQANEVVQASAYYSAQDDGLSQPWFGNIWMNPPYAADLVGRFAETLVRHWNAGEIDGAIVLVNNATETQWFQAVANVASAICFPRGRVRFWNPSGTVGAPLQGQAILYVGTAPESFSAEFARFGFVMVKS